MDVWERHKKRVEREPTEEKKNRARPFIIFAWALFPFLVTIPSFHLISYFVPEWGSRKNLVVARISEPDRTIDCIVNHKGFRGTYIVDFGSVTDQGPESTAYFGSVRIHGDKASVRYVVPIDTPDYTSISIGYECLEAVEDRL